MNKFTKIAALITVCLAMLFQPTLGQSCQSSSSGANLSTQIKFCYKELYKMAAFLNRRTSISALGRLKSKYNISTDRPCSRYLNINAVAMKRMSKNLTTSQILKFNKEILTELSNTLKSNSAKVTGSLPLVKTVLKDSIAMTKLMDVVLKKVQALRKRSVSKTSTASTTTASMRRPSIAAALLTRARIVGDMYCGVERLNAFALEMQIDFFNMTRSA